MLLLDDGRAGARPQGSTKVAANEGGSVDFEQVLKKVVWRLVTEGSVSYRRIKRSFGLDDDALEDVRRVLISALLHRGRLRRRGARFGCRGPTGPTRGHGAAAAIADLAAR